MAKDRGPLKIVITTGLICLSSIAPAWLHEGDSPPGNSIIRPPQAWAQEVEHAPQESRAFVVQRTTYEVSQATASLWVSVKTPK
jgi:hypothetical protein